jgi:hypothetical protein
MRKSAVTGVTMQGALPREGIKEVLRPERFELEAVPFVPWLGIASPIERR